MARVHRILVTDPLHADALARLEAAEDVHLLERSEVGEQGWAKELAEVDAWLIRSGTRIRAEQLEAAPRLRVVGRAGVGVDNVDLAAATARGVLVMNAPDANSTTTAELALAHLLALSRNLVQGDRMVREGRWERKALVGSEVEGKTLGVVGLGRIGRKLAHKAQALGMRVLAHDPFVGASAVEDSGIELRELDDLLPEVDYLSLHLPLTERTRGLIDARRLRSMKAGSRLINCARGGLVDEAALAEVLVDGPLAGAALDVFATEPPPRDHPLFARPNLVATPHLGASTREASRKVSLAIVDQALDFLRQGAVHNAVNLPALPAELMAEIEPWTRLAERCGRLVAQLVDWPLRSVRAEVHGEGAPTASRLLTTSFLVGLLQEPLEGPVNWVNAPALAAERGIEVEELRRPRPRDFEQLLEFEVHSASGRSRRVGGALFGHRMPRVVRIDGARMEVVPEGRLLLLRNQDRPGVVGRLGTRLGGAGINIGSMFVTPPAEDGLCWAVLSVEPGIPAALLEEIRSSEDIEEAHAVDLS